LEIHPSFRGDTDGNQFFHSFLFFKGGHGFYDQLILFKTLNGQASDINGRGLPFRN
jgi:hypothetical protein